MSGAETHLFVRCVATDEEFRWPDVGEFAVHSSRSPVKTSENEDAALLQYLGDGRAVLAVADGVGGQPAGEQAAQCALEELARTASEPTGEGASMRESMLSGFDRANRSVLDLGSGGATTLMAVTLEHGSIRTYHVGDSAAIAFGGRGKLKLETIPHSPVGYGVEAGLISAEDAFGHADRHLISNVVGDSDMHIGLSSPLELCPRDCLLVASDGLFDNVPLREIIEALRRGPLGPAVRALSSACRERMAQSGHPDDLTLIAHRPAGAP